MSDELGRLSSENRDASPSFSTSSSPSSIGGCAHSSARSVGEYLLVSQLGDDTLGSVYRALHTGDGRFVRLRLLQSPELAPRAVLAAVRQELEETAEPMERHRGLRISDGTPYLVWPEASGWTLDFVLARSRAGGWAMPVEFALSIAERAAAQIEQMRFSSPSGPPRLHGALWPGFVNITSDADVRVEGFGLSSAILPALSRSRMWRDVAPYLPSEARQTGRADETTDVYSIGVLLSELVTGRRASADLPPARWRADDEFSQEVNLLLRFALGARYERFASVVELRSSLRDLIAACPFEPSAADLALFLYDLLNPESRILPTPFDGNSTNPLSQQHERLVPATSATSLEPRAPVALALVAQRLVPASSHAEVTVFGGPPALRLVSRFRWLARAAAVAAALVGLLFADFPMRVRLPDAAPMASGPAASAFSPSPAALLRSGIESALLGSSASLSSGSEPVALDLASTARPARAAQRREAKTRSSVETLRLKAGLARIAAERLDAPIHAPGVFREGRSFEQQGEKLLRRGRYAAALDAYERALDLFTRAESLSREERVRTIRIAGTASGP
jgi:hypothetical protein